jgi:drug/metabolite transporter (DMT)-like permease
LNEKRINAVRWKPLTALLVGASMWGIIWYPYRLLAQAGVHGALATLASYLVALGGVTLLFRRAWREFGRAPVVLLLLGLASGWCNVAYVLGMLNGEVMRVLLLFYLAPLWTVPLAYFVLGERISQVGYAVVLTAFAGAVVMLWKPALGMPLPTNVAEWLGLSSGFCFAIANVLVRKAEGTGVAAKTLAVLAGVAVVSLITLTVSRGAAQVGPLTALARAWPLVLGIGAVLVVMGLAVQYGLSHTPATQAIVIMLFELVVAAVASYALAGEVMGVQEWIGGALIILASLFSGHLEPHDVRREVPVSVAP